MTSPDVFMFALFLYGTYHVGNVLFCPAVRRSRVGDNHAQAVARGGTGTLTRWSLWGGGRRVRGDGGRVAIPALDVQKAGGRPRGVQGRGVRIHL